ncbi:MAG: histidinol-phosphate transaminase, partial [Gammaproteobacteria bacterium]|nr:histidinol-phosphate transaminase [Gammaproteobacteria bacterium]
QQILPENITIGNGSNDVLEIIAHSFADHNAEVIYSQHAFAVYPIVTQAVGAKHVMTPAINWGHDLDAMVNAITDKTRLIFIANPNNPTGTWLSAKSVHSFLSQVPDNVIVVLDEAYHEFIEHEDYLSAIDWISEFPNLIVTRTFSKAYGLAGLRIGYGISHPAVTNILNRVRQPFNANSIALAAAMAALDDKDFLHKSIEVNNQGMQQLTDAFKEMSLDFIPSVGNFVCVDVKMNGNIIYEELLKKGVIVRPVGLYQMPDHLRVSVGSSAGNARFITALKEVLAELSLQ